MELIKDINDLLFGDSIHVLEYDNGSTNTFSGVVTYISHGEITLNDTFSFTMYEVNPAEQFIVRLEKAPEYTGRHRE